MCFMAKMRYKKNTSEIVFDISRSVAMVIELGPILITLPVTRATRSAVLKATLSPGFMFVFGSSDLLSSILSFNFGLGTNVMMN